MRSRTWAILLTGLAAVCLGLSLWLLRDRPPARYAQIWSDGVLVETLDLTQDCQRTINSAQGFNTLTVSGGRIAVTGASCPDGDCMAWGFRNSGAQIVCLPNRLVIRFLGQTDVDAVSG